jgi:hypothetical protein
MGSWFSELRRVSARRVGIRRDGTANVCKIIGASRNLLKSGKVKVKVESLSLSCFIMSNKMNGRQLAALVPKHWNVVSDSAHSTMCWLIRYSSWIEIAHFTKQIEENYREAQHVRQAIILCHDF